MTDANYFPETLERSHNGPDIHTMCTSETIVRGELFGMHEWDLERLPLDDERVTHVAAEYTCETCGRTLLRRGRA